MSVVIRVDAEVYRRIMDARTAFEAQIGRTVSMAEATRRAINLAQRREVFHEHAVHVDHSFGQPCARGVRHEGCCPGMCREAS